MRFFNTAGPVNCADHYCLPPLQRIDLEDVLQLLAQKKYFLLHAPRQTGKTSFLLALMEYLNTSGRYHAVYANIEAAQAHRDNVDKGMTTVVTEIAHWAADLTGDATVIPLAKEVLTTTTPASALGVFLSHWCQRTARPIVLMLDEADSLVGDTLISLLRQVRAGYPKRPEGFPQSVILCGVRDIQDYRIHSERDQAVITGGSAFNIKAVSLRMGDFTRDEVLALLQQHTDETGQVFTPAALELVWTLTAGQPWLVNALAYAACFENKAGRQRTVPITVAMIEQAKEDLIVARVTHLNQLADKLREPRVRHIIEPMLAGQPTEIIPDDDRQYLVDLGLLRRDPAGGLVVANPIYREVIPRVLAGGPQDSLPHIAPTWLTPDGSLDPERLLTGFLAFWRQHGELLLGSAPYHEIAPHLVLMAFLHRVVNGGGSLEREYAIGRGRMDLCLRYGAVTLGIELKVWREGKPDPLPEGLAQLDGYLDGLGLTTGWLVLFDQRRDQPPMAQRTNATAVISPAGRTLTVIRA